MAWTRGKDARWSYAKTKVVRGNMCGVRKRGRTRNRWIQDVEKSLKTIGEGNRK